MDEEARQRLIASIDRIAGMSLASRRNEQELAEEWGRVEPQYYEDLEDRMWRPSPARAIISAWPTRMVDPPATIVYPNQVFRPSAYTYAPKAIVQPVIGEDEHMDENTYAERFQLSAMKYARISRMMAEEEERRRREEESCGYQKQGPVPCDRRTYNTSKRTHFIGCGASEYLAACDALRQMAVRGIRLPEVIRDVEFSDEEVAPNKIGERDMEYRVTIYAD